MTATVGGSATGRPRVPRGVAVGGAVLVAVFVAAILGGRPGSDGPPLDPRSDGPLGTSALVSLIRGLDAEVELSVGLPGPADDVALLLHDRLTAEQETEVERWVRRGGTLVVTDPGSTFTPPVSFAPPPLAEGDDAEAVRPERCDVDALADVQEVNGGALVRYRTDGATGQCFSNRDGAFVVVAEEGDGEIVSIGGAAFVTNDLLGDVDNAVLAAALLAPEPGTAVRFVDAPLPAGGGDKTLADLVPGSLKRGLLQVGIAFVLYAVWRAIRLGQPVPEDQPVEVAGSELVAAVGRLLARTRSPGDAAETLRAETRRALSTRFGVPPDAPPEALAASVAAASPVDEAAVLAAVDHRPVGSESELVAVAQAVSLIHQEVLR